MSAAGGSGRTRWLAVGLLALAFVAGALGGVAADRLLSSAPAPEPAGPRGGAPPGAVFPPGFAIARELDLTPEQRERIQAILAAERSKADSVMRAVRPLLQARYDSSLQAVRAVLTPEQRDRFDQLREQRRDRVLRRAPRRGPRGER